MQIQVYLCPTEGCNDYYGTAGMGDLSEKFVGTRGPNFEMLPPERRRSRQDCPTCFNNGLGRVPRVLTAIEVARPPLRIAPAA